MLKFNDYLVDRKMMNKQGLENFPRLSIVTEPFVSELKNELFFNTYIVN